MRKHSLAVSLLVLGGLAFTPSLALAQQHSDRDPDGTLRFHMTQDGRKMTANDFDAWMAQRGLRVSGRQVVWSNPASAALHRSGSMGSGAMGSGAMTGGTVSGATFSGGAGAMPIPTAPARAQAQYDSNGNLTGYNSGWSGNSGVGSHSSYSSGSGARRGGVLTSYDSGRD